MKKYCLLLFLLSNLIFSQNIDRKKNHFQTAGHVLKTSFNTIPKDFVYLGNEFSNDWKKTGYYGARVVGLLLTDKITTNFWHKTVEPAINNSLPNILRLLKSKKRPYNFCKIFIIFFLKFPYSNFI
ncbi:hypothetical protein [uncultured Lutibacter sp.]|uniref:hypothetical protein n=1 Tax=uncultured Lutibacter sp. TaxID=437739 RepID=UPI00260E9395|nr:hypothetical protein [uncultured Lutibacter sp.]